MKYETYIVSQIFVFKAVDTNIADENFPFKVKNVIRKVESTSISSTTYKMRTPEQRIIEDNYCWFGFYTIALILALVYTFISDVTGMQRIAALFIISPQLLGFAIMTYRNWRAIASKD